ncbi:MAG: sulfotransferase [Pseudomonadota bacterium]
MPQSNPFSFTPQSRQQPSQLSLAQAMQLAAQLQGQGRLQEAEHLVRQILQQQPDHAFALHLLGVIAHQVGKNEQARQLILRAIGHNGEVALFHANLCEIVRQMGKPEAAVEHGKQAVALAPKMAMAHSNLGIAYYDLRDYVRAEACQKQVLAIDPDFAPSLNNLGNIWRERGQNDAAIAWYRKAISARPDYLEPLSNLGALLLEEDRLEEAEETLQKALRINPKYAEAVCNMSGVKLALEKNDEALAGYQRALKLRPDYVEALMGLSKTHQSMENFPEAKTAAERTLELNPANHKVHGLLGSVYRELGQQQDAESAYLKSLDLKPEYGDAILGLGDLCMEIGQMERAEELFSRALSYKPDSLAARIHLSQVRKVRPDDENLAALLAKEKDIEKFPEGRQMSLHFALGKCLDDIKDYDRAFPHFLAGCKLKRAKLDYDPQATTAQFAEIAQLFSKENIERLRGAGNDDPTPIFVLGMPRSGTTLTEQIIASHPDVFGAGELPDLLRIAHRKTRSDQSRFPDNLKNLDAATLTKWGTEYLSCVRQRNADSARITDKMPANFFMVGLIHLMLPKAKIIHVNRNPVDTCLSCFTRLFKRKQEHTYDLAELGRYYTDYARLMNHWRTVLPAGAFLDIQYEDTVADQEAQARRLLEYCELGWHDACLDFHKTERPIRTASVTQVRQPIYTSSVERWRKYEKFLDPLLNELGELVPNRRA